MLNLKPKIAPPTDLTLSFFRGTMTKALLMAMACTINVGAVSGSPPADEPEVRTYDSIGSRSMGSRSMGSRMERSEIDAAIALGNLNALGRIDKASRLEALYDAMIETERARIVLRESMARRRSAAKQRAEGIKNSLAANAAIRIKGTGPLPETDVQVTTYQESGFDGNSATADSGTDPVATLIRPGKYSLAVPNQGPQLESQRGYKPLVVARPPNDRLGSERVQPSTQIDLAKSATQSQLEPVVVDDSIASNRVSAVINAAEKPLGLPQPPPLPQPPALQPPASPQAATVVVAELPAHALARSISDSVAVDQESEPGTEPATEPQLASMLSTAFDTSPQPEQVTVSRPASEVPVHTPNLPATPQVQRSGKDLSEANSAPYQTAASHHPTRGGQVDALPVGYHLAHHPVAVQAEESIVAEQPGGDAAQPVQTQRIGDQAIAVAPGAGVAEATVAMQWPFTGGGRTEELPTPQNGYDVTLNVDDVDVRTVLEMLAKSYGMNILVAPDVEGIVTANVAGLTPEQTLNSVVRMCGLAIQREGNVILVYPRDNLPRESRQLRVFQLDFARSELIEPTVTGLLSSIGSAYSSTVDELDNRKGREAIVVIDTPDVLAQVENYIMQADQPPRQVMIEARVLEIELRDDMEHGVNFEALLGGDFRVGGLRLTDNIATSTNPFYFAEIDSTKLDALITMLETTTDAKTLATPRVMVVNGQNAKIQVGQQLGFAVATVTQTSTIQDVRYLDTGVVLQVTPTISRDNRVLLSVKPKVSSGEINPDTLLPEETTREVETSVMLGNHQGMIIGGLIQEDDRVVIKKMPWLGDVKYVGKFFQRRETTRARTEIIVALIPHIIESCEDGHCEIDDPLRKQIEWERTENRLFNGPLNRECRPWEPRLPDVTGETGFHRDIDRLRNIDPYGKGCEPIKTGLLSTD